GEKMKLKDFDFRIWSYNIEEYLQPKNTYLAIVKDEKGLDSYEKVLDVADDSADVEVELFTGFHDKNDTKIYEGDILRIQLDYNKVEKGFVQYHNGIFKVINRKASHEYCVTFLGICYIKDCVEIIGNIHENAELLK
ncbi:TPA: YopX family protein, partial [Campylobacter jejuni]